MLIRDEKHKASDLEHRLSSLDLTLPAPSDDIVSAEYIALVITTRGRGEQGDTLHQLVMDVHKALNRLQGDAAVSHIDGAFIPGL